MNTYLSVQSLEPFINDWSGAISLNSRHDWSRAEGSITDRYSRLARLPLSTLGRGFAASSYALSTLLYHAEFVGLPPPHVSRPVERDTAAMVDRREAPALRLAREAHRAATLARRRTGGTRWRRDAPAPAGVARDAAPSPPSPAGALPHSPPGLPSSPPAPPPWQPDPPPLAPLPPRRFAGLSMPMLIGAPGTGGFGVLPLEAHLLARHACWAARLLQYWTDRKLMPWVVALSLELESCLGRGASPLALFTWPSIPRPAAPSQGRTVPPTLPLIHPTLCRLGEGLRALGPVTLIRPLATPGPWCAVAPLWDNPLIPGGGLGGLPPPSEVPSMRRVPGLVTVADLVEFHAAVWGDGVPPTSRFYSSDWHFFSDGAAHDQPDFDEAIAALPSGWYAAAEAAVASGAVPPPSAFLGKALRSLGWLVGKRTVHLAGLSVRDATAIQMHHLTAPRQARQSQFVMLVTRLDGLGIGPAPASSPEVLTLLPKLWEVRCLNSTKEVYWRLMLNALPTADRIPTLTPCRCTPEGARPDRSHVFWQCPMAQAVVLELRTHLSTWRQRRAVAGPLGPGLGPAGAPAALPPLQPSNLWLARPPRGVLARPWRLACLCAIDAMDYARRTTCATRGAISATSIGRRAVAYMWARLQTFCDLNLASEAWRRAAPQGPFVCYHVESSSWRLAR